MGGGKGRESPGKMTSLPISLLPFFVLSLQGSVSAFWMEKIRSINGDEPLGPPDIQYNYGVGSIQNRVSNGHSVYPQRDQPIQIPGKKHQHSPGYIIRLLKRSHEPTDGDYLEEYGGKMDGEDLNKVWENHRGTIMKRSADNSVLLRHGRVTKSQGYPFHEGNQHNPENIICLQKRSQQPTDVDYIGEYRGKMDVLLRYGRAPKSEEFPFHPDNIF